MCCSQTAEQGTFCRGKYSGMCRAVILEPELPTCGCHLILEMAAVADTALASVPVSDSPKCGQKAFYCRIADWFEEPREIIPY